MAIFLKKLKFLAIILKKSQVFGNFLTVKWQFSGGSGGQSPAVQCRVWSVVADRCPGGPCGETRVTSADLCPCGETRVTPGQTGHETDGRGAPTCGWNKKLCHIWAKGATDWDHM